MTNKITKLTKEPKNQKHPESKQNKKAMVDPGGDTTQKKQQCAKQRVNEESRKSTQKWPELRRTAHEKKTGGREEGAGK